LDLKVQATLSHKGRGDGVCDGATAKPSPSMFSDTDFMEMDDLRRKWISV